MSHGIHELQPDANTLSQLSVVVMPAQQGRVGGIMAGANSPIGADGTLNLAKVAASGDYNDLINLPAVSAEPANQVYCGPASGAAAQPVFRRLVTADLPPASTISVNGALAGSVTNSPLTINGAAMP